MSKLEKCYSIADLRLLAKKRVPKAVFDYMDGGADDEASLARNRDGFERYQLVPKTLVDVSQVDMSTSILGQKIDLPVILAPTGMSRLFHHEGETAVVRAAKTAGTIYSLSSMSTRSIEEVADVAEVPLCFQIYVWKDRALVRDFMQRCKHAGYSSLCLTVDFATAGRRERDLRNGFTVPPTISLGTVLDTLRRPAWLWHYLTTARMTIANVKQHRAANSELFSIIDYTTSQFDPSVSWKDLSWMIEEWDGPFAIKGIMHPDDARRAVDCGASAVIVSNHGGRQLDHTPATIDVLPDIIDGVAGEAEVIIDSGIRRGTDVIKALALGAQACMIGRAYLYGLAAAGEAGVNHALNLLREEIQRDLMLLGCRSISELNSEHLRAHHLNQG